MVKCKNYEPAFLNLDILHLMTKYFAQHPVLNTLSVSHPYTITGRTAVDRMTNENVFVFYLLHDTVSISDYVASSDRMIGEE
jgi:hypothetical protein